MKKIFLILFVIFFVIQTYDYAQASEYYISEANLTINLPNDYIWSVSEKYPPNMLKQYEFVENNIPQIIIISIVENENTIKLKDISNINASDFVQLFKKNLLNASKLKNVQVTTDKLEQLDNITMAHLDYIYKDTDNILYNRGFITLKNGQVITIRFVYLDKNIFEKFNQRDFDIINNIKITNDGTEKRNTSSEIKKTTQDTTIGDAFVAIIAFIIFLITLKILGKKDNKKDVDTNSSNDFKPIEKESTILSKNKDIKNNDLTEKVIDIKSNSLEKENISIDLTTNRSVKYTSKDIENIVDWRIFEQFVAGQFKIKNFKVILTPRTNDGGKDIIIEKDGIKTYIECKYWNSNKSIGREEIQKLAGATMMDGVKNALFITTSTYNENAIEAAKALNKNGFNINLWTTNDLLAFINQ